MESIRREVLGYCTDFNNRENLYRTRRDEFRDNDVAMNELAHWKAYDNIMEYKVL